MHDKAKAISAELLRLDLKVQLYNPFFNDKLVIIMKILKLKKIKMNQKVSEK